MRRARRVKNPDQLFARWLWLVYAPLGFLVAFLALLPFGILPGWMKWLLVPVVIYDGLAIRLLIERKKTGLEVPAPRKIVTGVTLFAALVIVGGVLLAIGISTLGSWQGLIVASIGGFLMILSVTAPLFKFLDVVFRAMGNLFTRKQVKSSKSESEGPA